MEQIIKFYVREVYGNRLMYVADKEQKYGIQLLTGQKSLTEQAKEGLEKLGFKFVEISRIESDKENE